MKRERDKLNEEKQFIINDQNLIAEEKEKLLKDMKMKEQQLKKEQEAKTELARKLEQMESKLLSGDKNIYEHTTEQEKKLQERRFVFSRKIIMF
jgi:DNA replication initiation complex subunit (GINS family)